MIALIFLAVSLAMPSQAAEKEPSAQSDPCGRSLKEAQDSLRPATKDPAVKPTVHLEHEYRLILNQSQFGDSNLPPQTTPPVDRYEARTTIHPDDSHPAIQRYPSMEGLAANLIGFNSHGFSIHAPLSSEWRWTTGQTPILMPASNRINRVVNVQPDWPLVKRTTIIGTQQQHIQQENLIAAVKYDATYFDTRDNALGRNGYTLRLRTYNSFPKSGENGVVFGRKVTLKVPVEGDSLDHRREEHSFPVSKDGPVPDLRAPLGELLKANGLSVDASDLIPTADLPNHRLVLRVWSDDPNFRTPVSSIILDCYKLVYPDGTQSIVFNEIEAEISGTPETYVWMQSHRTEFESFLESMKQYIGGESEWSKVPKIQRAGAKF